MARACLAALVAALAGCGPEEPAPPSDPCAQPAPAPNYRALTSPTAPLVDLALAYNRRDDQAVAQYASLLDSTLFVRYFAGQHPPGHFAPSWDYAAEQSAFDAYVDDPTILGAHLTMIAATSDTLGAPSDSLNDPPGTLKFTMPNVELRICREAANYQTAGSYTFYVAARESVSGQPAWRIIRWRDETQ